MLDLVVYGATGFTGRLICNYLRRCSPVGLTWAIAGRDGKRLEEVAAAAEASLPEGEAGAGAPPSEIIANCNSDTAPGLLSKRATVGLPKPPSTAMAKTVRRVPRWRTNCNLALRCAHSTACLPALQVVLSAAGPFMRHSDGLVAACARNGTSYVDINGEVPWVCVPLMHGGATRARTAAKAVRMRV